MPENYNFEERKEDEEEDFTTEQRPSQGIGKGQKYAAIGLGIFAIIVIGMWMAQFKKSLSQPFAYQVTDSGNEASTCQGPDCGQASAEELKNKDTDKDGISDWDELNVYSTSPYLEDSDSDGFTDKNEIDSENDPNCPVGRDCYATALSSPGETNEESSLNTLLDQFQYQEGLEAPAGAATAPENLLGDELDAASLRQMLIEYGMDKDVLDQVSDEELMNSFSEIMAE